MPPIRERSTKAGGLARGARFLALILFALSAVGLGLWALAPGQFGTLETRFFAGLFAGGVVAMMVAMAGG